MMTLSDRMEMLVRLCPASENFADIGTDHGFLPIAMVERGRARRALACDIRSGPLKAAREHIRQAGLEDRIELRLGNGLSVLKAGEADTILIAGMGGLLIRDILETSFDVASQAGALVISAHSEAAALRRYLTERGFSLEEEDFVKDEGKYYPAFRVSYRKETSRWTEEEYEWGSIHFLKGNADLMEAMHIRQTQLENVVRSLQLQNTAGAAARKDELTSQLEQLKKYMEMYR